MQCLGKNKNGIRCRNNTKLFFCKHHLPTLWIGKKGSYSLSIALFILTIVGLIGGIYQDILKPILIKRSEPPIEEIERIINGAVSNLSINEEFNINNSSYTHDELVIMANRAKIESDSYIHKANALFVLKEYDEAISNYKDAIDLNPVNSQAKNSLAITLFEVGEYSESLCYLDEVILNERNIALFYYNRAVVHHWLGHIDLAFSDYDKTLLIEPLFIEALTRRAALYSEINDFGNSLVNYMSAYEIAPSSKKIINNIIRIFLEMNEADSALLYVNKLLKFDENDTLNIRLRSQIYHKMDQHDKEREDLKTINKIAQ